ncbi:hypothetical protein Tsubulata_041002 [Turnera subulata]|uniref:Uncharacterized protein n=1 Tax=Turnera subulata TaxID=218843 RepID=A0A9Q0FRW3_9ROSI|nr:hypothetical protein Tsubulata_041002 [Turnera subulata]
MPFISDESTLLIALRFLACYLAIAAGAVNSGFCITVFLVGGVVLALTMLVLVVARATLMTWITVLVLLRVAGKRRRVLVRQGSKIIGDVIMILVKG